MRLGFFTLLFLLSVPFLSMAQIGFEPQNELTISPAYPKPGESFTVKVDDYAGGLFGAQISWYYNGAEVPNSLNQRSVTLNAVSLGQQGVVEAVFLTQTGAEQKLQKVIKPIYVDLIIEPQTRVPEWYEGRALPSFGSQINATVLVDDGDIVSPQNLIYSWSMNSKPVHGGPVRAQHKTSFPAPRGTDMILSVSVSRVNGEVLASRATRIPIVEPDLLFFERHSLYGLQKFPIKSSLGLIGNTVMIQAEPFNLDTRVYNRPDIATWDINGVETNNGASSPYQITLQPSGAGGTSRVNFHVRSLETLSQGVDSSVNITFN